VPITIKSCPICSHEHFNEYLTVKDHSISKQNFNIVSCKSCGFRFTNPIPDENEIGAYYQSEDYVSHSDSTKGIVNKLYHFVRNRSLKSKLKIINGHAKKGTVLDIGCGTGYFLKICKEDGWHIDGMEPDQGARMLAQQNTGMSIKGNLFDINPPTKYNIITMWHVLEHVHKLNDSIQHIYNLLEDNGTLVVAVPNINSYDSSIYKEYWAALDVPRHLYHFTQKDVDKLLTKSGFTKEKIYPMVYDSFYVSMLSTRYKYGATNYLKSFLTGILSNIKATKTGEYSSLIYIYKKNA
jgi:2-polyprenyl-3-methyl-5-hydroxy-6-metoxy-1,4-benzoquinol methylase